MLFGLLARASSYGPEQKVCKVHKTGQKILWIDATFKIFHPHILALLHYGENYCSPICILKCVCAFCFNNLKHFIRISF